MATFTYSAIPGSTPLSEDEVALISLNTFGMTGTVTNVSVTLNGLSHEYANQLDMLLVAPDGNTNLAFWSDALGSQALVNANYTISDSGATQLVSINTPVTVSGTYRPADYELGFETGADYGQNSLDVLHAGPSGGGTFANAFTGVDPNGLWYLLIRDDTTLQSGSLAGAKLTVTTTGTTIILQGSAAADYLNVVPANSTSGQFTFGGNPSVAYSGVTSFVFDGGLGNDNMTGSAGGDVLTGGFNRDTVFGGLGNDRLIIAENDLDLAEVYNGGGGTDTLELHSDSNAIFSFGDNTISSIEIIAVKQTGTGTTSMFFDAAQFGSGIASNATIDLGGFAGNTAEMLIGMQSAQSLNLSGLIFSGFTGNVLTAFIAGDDDAESIVGTSRADTILGSGGNDSINGSLGTDSMHGGNGSDTYYVDVDGDTVVEQNSDVVVGGYDTVFFSGTIFGLTLSDNVERLILTGTAATYGTGNYLANSIIGNVAANVLDGGFDTYVDTLSGGAGNDTYLIQGVIPNDRIIEAAGNGTADRVQSFHTIVLATGVDIEFLETINPGNANAINLTGNEIAQTITGNVASNVLKGMGGKDILNGLAGIDTADFSDKTLAVVAALNGAVATNVTVGGVIEDSVKNIENLTGGTALDTLTGDGLANILNGGADALADNLAGGLGNDTYIINSATDNIIELAGGGTADRAQANISFVLVAGDNIEFLETTNAAAVVSRNLTGNEIAQTITGNAGVNILNGGIDTLRDILVGGLGNDTYIINTATDNIVELAGEGTADRAKSSVSFKLAAGDDIEFLETTSAAGVGAINLTGNEIAQTITGNAGANILNGGTDLLADILIGGLGNDTYVINSVNDEIVESVGGGTADRVNVTVSYNLAAGDNIEIMQTTSIAGTSNLVLSGNEIAQSITGNAGSNLLAGEGGNDTLTGAFGADSFLFNTALNAATNLDVITDYNVASDTIYLDDLVFATLVPTGVALAANLFKNLTTGGPVDADDRILYNDATGAIFYDSDGNGGAAAIQFATLTGTPTVDHNDFFVL